MFNNIPLVYYSFNVQYTNNIQKNYCLSSVICIFFNFFWINSEIRNSIGNKHKII